MLLLGMALSCTFKIIVNLRSISLQLPDDVRLACSLQLLETRTPSSVLSQLLIIPRTGPIHCGPL